MESTAVQIDATRKGTKLRQQSEEEAAGREEEGAGREPEDEIGKIPPDNVVSKCVE